jgi:hypothetical protein
MDPECTWDLFLIEVTDRRNVCARNARGYEEKSGE